MFFMDGGFPGMGGSRRGGGGPVDTQLYELLRVQPTASADEIKKSYRQLAREYHPDKNPEHGDKFKEISAAYEILSDPRKREIYDQVGLEGMEGGGSGGFGGEDIFNMFGGGGGGGIFNLFGGGGSRGRRQRRKGEDTVQPLGVTLEDLYKGKTSKLQLTKKVLCADCEGRGGKEGAVQTCTGCRGQGRVLVTRQVGPGMIQQMQRICDSCNGEGQIISEKDRCKKCAGKKTVQEQKIIEVAITPGMRDGQKIVFYNEGDQEPGVQPGDVILVVKTKPHDEFQRRDDDLWLKRSITLNEALCGYTTVITHLDGRKLILRSKPGEVIKMDSVRGVIGEGMPSKDTNGHGNLYIQFSIDFPPNHFTDENAIKQLEFLLPKRPTPPTIPADSEEVSLSDFDERRYEGMGGGRREAYHDDDESDEDAGGPGAGMGGQRVQCAQQ